MATVIDSILREYPYPIAKCYERLISARDLSERWNSARYLIEVTIKYSACASIAQYLHYKDFNERTNAALTCLTRPSLGHWVSLFGRCYQDSRAAGRPGIGHEAFTKLADAKLLLATQQAMGKTLEGASFDSAKVPTPYQFLENYVAYRNRTAGHGAPSASHIEGVTPLLADAAAALLVHMASLKETQLLHIADIRLDRRSCMHGITRLMGTSFVPMPDYVTELATALVGHDRKLFLSTPGDDRPTISMHPLAIFNRNEVYLLHCSDLKRNVDYMCHHTGENYAADRIYEDFRDALGDFMDIPMQDAAPLPSMEIYEEAVRMSLTDGTISADERQMLSGLQQRLELTDEAVRAIESRLRQIMPAPADAPASGASSNGSVAPQGGGSVIRGFDSSRQAATRIVFLSYASVGNGFWGEFVSHLASGAHDRGWVFSMVTPNTAQDHDAAAMAGLIADLDRIIALHEPSLIILVPFPSPTFGSLFRKRMSGFDIPVLVIDTELIASDAAADKYPSPPPPAVRLNNEAGGRIAAEMLASHSSNLSAGERYLVMPGLKSAAHSQARVDGFQSRLKELQPGVRIRVLQEGLFNRDRATEVFLDYLEDSDISRDAGIFCCNDDMAFGVYLAMSQAFSGKGQMPPFSIVGFNASSEFKTLARADPYKLLVGSVDQSIQSYAGIILDKATALLEHKSLDALTLITPQVWSTSDEGSSWRKGE